MSLTTIQTKGLKRHLQEEELESYINSIEPTTYNEFDEPVVNALKGAKKRRIALLNKIQQTNGSNDPSTLGLDVSKKF